MSGDCAGCGDNSILEISADNENEVIQVLPSSSFPCGKCGQLSCGCQGNVPLVPQPFYGEVHAQKNTKNVFNTRYSLGFSIANAVNMPACGQSVVLSVPQILSVVLGTYIYNPEIGYLRIASFDKTKREVTCVNDCEAGNIPA